MKKVDINIWEISRKEIAKLPDKTHVLVYNTLFKDYKLIRSDRLVLMLHKLSEFHVFFTLDEPDFNFSTEKRTNKEKKRA